MDEATLVAALRRHWEYAGQGNFWVGENSIRYDGGPWNCTCSLLEFRGDKVARETIYITQAWDAPEWRAAWVPESAG